mmetsp:Transcript_2808/g.7867  ORF Transcript_2808/g.7867 Transcript_2808/m.7867 type:complete len:441 (-) Transcript_2808:1115-2437(-)
MIVGAVTIAPYPQGFLVRFEGGGIVLAMVLDQPHARQRAGHVDALRGAVVGPRRLHVQNEFVRLQRSRVVPPILVDVGDVGQRDDDVRMVLGQHMDLDSVPLAVVIHRRLKVSQLVRQVPKPIEERGDFGMVLAQRNACRFVRLLQKEHGIPGVLLLLVQFGHALVNDGHVSRLFADRMDGELQEHLVVLHRGVQLFQMVVALSRVVHGGGNVDRVVAQLGFVADADGPVANVLADVAVTPGAGAIVVAVGTRLRDRLGQQQSYGVIRRRDLHAKLQSLLVRCKGLIVLRPREVDAADIVQDGGNVLDAVGACELVQPVALLEHCQHRFRLARWVHVKRYACGAVESHGEMSIERPLMRRAGRRGRCGQHRYHRERCGWQCKCILVMVMMMTIRLDIHVHSIFLHHPCQYRQCLLVGLQRHRIVVHPKVAIADIVKDGKS